MGACAANRSIRSWSALAASGDESRVKWRIAAANAPIAGASCAAWSPNVGLVLSRPTYDSEFCKSALLLLKRSASSSCCPTVVARRSTDPASRQEVAIGGHGWPGPPEWPKVAVWSAIEFTLKKISPVDITEHDNGLFLEAKLLFEIKNVGRVAAYNLLLPGMGSSGPRTIARPDDRGRPDKEAAINEMAEPTGARRSIQRAWIVPKSSHPCAGVPSRHPAHQSGGA